MMNENEDHQCYDQVIEYWHGWFWYRFLMGVALLSEVVHICEDHPECETIGNLPEADSVAEKMAIAQRQYEILGHNRI